ncbi:phosphate-starvation-inducible PsiE family protein [Cyanobium sp. FGCU-52]|nr:phosphate-starvation-inducible PsiE family protein [Cyanobium sp. FGCU52]
MRSLLRWFTDAAYLRLADRAEQQLAKLLGLLLLVVTIFASFQLIISVVEAMVTPNITWYGERLVRLLGDLLTLLIAIEVLQNLNSYLRHHTVQIELVLLTAITAVARKVIVLPAGAENKPLLLAGLGVAVLFLALAYVLVRRPARLTDSDEREPARSSREARPSPPADGDAPPESREHPPG